MIKPPAPDPKTEPLLAELADPATKPERRLEIGDQLAELGDPRAGVGLDPDGRPAIDRVAIPAGSFLYGEKRERREHDAFRVGRLPITNAQYQAFIAAGGYAEKRWWDGLEQRIAGRTQVEAAQPPAGKRLLVRGDGLLRLAERHPQARAKLGRTKGP